MLGIVERGGSVKTKKAQADDYEIIENIVENVKKDSQIISDQRKAYSKTKRIGYKHLAVNHGKREYVRGEVHTNTIEGFWSQLKRSLDGTYHSVSPKHLQAYLDEFSFRYNLRKSPVPVFYHLLAKLVG